MANGLLPLPKQLMQSDAWNPGVAYHVYTYAAGTLTPKTTYQDFDGLTPNTNPILVDARGEYVMYGTGNYRIIAKTDTDVTIWDRDNVQAPFSTYDDQTIDDLIKNKLIVTVKTIAELRALDSTLYTHAFLTGYYAEGDGGGGNVFYFDAADTTSADNQGTLIVATDNARWKRVYECPLAFEWFGAIPGSVDYTNSMKACAAVANVSGEAIGLRTGQYLVSDTIGFNKAILLEGHGSSSVIKINPSLSLADKRFAPIIFSNSTPGQLLDGEIVLRNFDVDGSNGGPIAGGLIEFGSVNSAISYDIHAYDAGTQGVEGLIGVSGIYNYSGVLGGAESNVTVYHCLFERCTETGVRYGQGSVNVKIIQSTSRNNAGTGQSTGFTVAGAYNTLISGCDAYSNEGCGIAEAQSGNTTDDYRLTRYYELIGNKCYRNGTGAIVGHGIYITNGTLGVFSGIKAKVCNNQCWENGVVVEGDGIRIESENGVSTTDNYCYRNRGNGIVGNNMNFLDISDNECESNNLNFYAIVSIVYSTGVATVTTIRAHGFTAGVSSIAIRGADELDYNQSFTVQSTPSSTTFTINITPVLGTLLNDGSNGIVINYTTGTSHITQPNGAGIFLGNSTQGFDIVIKKNKCFDSEVTKSQQYGLFVNGSNFGKLNIDLNDFKGNAIGEIGFVGALPSDLYINQKFEKQTNGNMLTFPIIMVSQAGGSFIAEIDAFAREISIGADCAYFESKNLLHDTAGTLASIGSVITPSFTSNTNYHAQVIGAGNQIRFQIQGDTGQTVNWRGTYKIRSL